MLRSLDQAGAGLLTAMMTFVALGGATFYVSKSMNQNQNILHKNAKMEAHRELVDMMRNYLYAGNNCTQALKPDPTLPGVSLVTGVVGSGTGDPVQFTMKMGQVDQLLKPDFVTPAGVKVKSIRLKIDNIVRSPVRIHLDPLPKTAANATLLVETTNAVNLMKRDVAGTMMNEHLQIKLFVYYEEVGGVKQIYSCHDPSSEAAFCTNVMKGAYYHDNSTAANSESRCQPDLQCFYYKSGLISVTDPCPSPFSASTEAGNSGLRSCSWCHPNGILGSVVATAGFASANELDLDLETESGSEVSCSSAGYGGLNDVDSWNARQDYQSQIGYLDSADQAAYNSCLSYVPPRPGCYGQTINNCALGSVSHSVSSGSCTNGKVGSCQYRCDTGTWYQSSNNCVDPTPCGASNFSGCIVGNANNSESSGSCQSGYTGSCSFTCNMGSWRGNYNSCTPPPGRSCPAGNFGGCRMPAGNDGDERPGTCIRTRAVRYGGECSGICSNGSWQVDAYCDGEYDYR